MKFFIILATIATASANGYFAAPAVAVKTAMKTEYQSQVNHVINDKAPVLLAVPRAVPMIAAAPALFSSPLIDARPRLMAAAPLAATKLENTWAAAPAIANFAAAPIADARILSNNWAVAPSIANFAAAPIADARILSNNWNNWGAAPVIANYGATKL